MADYSIYAIAFGVLVGLGIIAYFDSTSTSDQKETSAQYYRDIYEKSS